MIKALKNKWFVAVRHDSISGYKTRMLGGNDDARQFIIAKENSWKWWKEGTNETIHPWAAITVLTPKDSLEVAYPAKGVNIRIRCWWDGVRNSIKYPLTQLEQLTVDHVVIKPEDIKKGEKRGADYYSLYSITDPTEGKHLIEAKFLNLKTKATKVITQEFTYKKK